jgi:phosphoribosylglycinamide formyltransferase-1
MKKIRIAILASGSGSNAEAIMKWASKSSLAEVVCVGSNKKEAFVLERAKRFDVPTFVVSKRRSDAVESFDLRMLGQLEKYAPDWIILAGYMKLLTPVFLERYPKRVINIHPSLLPLFPGTDGYGEAYRAGVSESGCTIHYVDEGVDTGEIIAQTKIPLHEGESFEEFKARGLAVENQFYPEVIERILEGRL